MQTHSRTKLLVNLSLLCALAYVIMAVGRIPFFMLPTFSLKYDPKDVIIVMGGFIYGPMVSLSISLVVSFIEMITVSTTAWIGFFMNVISSVCFACPAAFIYKRKQTMISAVLGLVCGALLTVAAMLLWNYVLTPIFMNIPRAVVIPMLWTVFLPFNLLKTSINAAVILLVYRPLLGALRRANLIPQSPMLHASDTKRPIGVILVAALVLITCISFVYVYYRKPPDKETRLNEYSIVDCSDRVLPTVGFIA